MNILIENTYKIPKSTYEYCLKNFMYPNYNKIPKETIYHNTHLEYVDAIARNGILISKAKQLEYSGNMTWATTLPNQKGYGGCTVAFTLDGLADRYDYEMVNSVEYCIYKDIPAKNILFIDLPVVDGSGIGLTRLSDIPELIEEYGVEKVQNVFNKYGDKYIPLEDILPYIKTINFVTESIDEDDEDWFVIDDTRKSRFYDYESLEDVKRLAKFYYKNYPVSNKFNTVIGYITKDLTPNHSKAFIAEVISYVDMLRGNKEVDPYDLALDYFDKSFTDKEIEKDLIKQGYSANFITQVFDYINEFPV